MSWVKWIVVAVASVLVACGSQGSVGVVDAGGSERVEVDAAFLAVSGEIMDDIQRAQVCYPCCPWFDGLETWDAQRACCAENHLRPCNPPEYVDLGDRGRF